MRRPRGVIPGGELPVAVPVRQNLRLGAYLARQKLARREKFPLIVELEPLFACNLACVGCGKIQYPAHILKQRMSVATAVAAVEECGAPMVSIAGGEPLIHPEAHLIAAELVARRKFVYFCTNALLMRKKMDNFSPSPYFAWAVHLDGLRERHDASVDHAGTFDEAVGAIREAQRRGFRVTTNTTFFNTDTPQTVREVLDFLNDDLRVDQMMISPPTPTGRRPTRSISWASSRPGSCSARHSPTAAAGAGGSTTPRCSWISWRARPTSPALPGESRATRSSAGSGRAT